MEKSGVTAGVHGIRTGLFSKMREITANWPDDGYDSVESQDKLERIVETVSLSRGEQMGSNA